jgi:hypothetical protein
MKRNSLGLLLALALGLWMLVGYTGNQAMRAAGKSSAKAHNASRDSLLFPRDDYTEETKTVRTSAGEKKITYRSAAADRLSIRLLEPAQPNSNSAGSQLL